MIPTVPAFHANPVLFGHDSTPRLLAFELEGDDRIRIFSRGEDGQIRRFINFYVNEEDIRFLGNEKYSFQEGDEVLVIPSIAGG